MLPSFAAQYGYKIKLCATDVVLACAAVLEGVVSVCLCVYVCKCGCGCDSVYMFDFCFVWFLSMYNVH